MKKLVLSPELSLPLETATRRLAILAMSGAGKSNVAVVMAEQMFAAGIPWVAIDPKGDWWGVRSSKDGKHPGLPVTIFGGLHGDIPLEPTAGQLIADAIVDQRLTCILDISEFPTRQQQWGIARLGDGERRILEHLIGIYPEPISRVDLGAAVGYNLGGGRPAGYVGKLTSMGFADIPSNGMLVAGKLLYPAGLR